MKYLAWLLTGLVVLNLVGFGATGITRVRQWVDGQSRIPYLAWQSRPYLHSGDRTRKTAFHSGDAVFIHIVSQRSMSCYSEVHTRIISLGKTDPQQPAVENTTIWYDYPDTRTYTVAGSYARDFRLTLPSDMPPGPYFFERVTASICEQADRPIYQAEPLISFNIVN